MLSLARSRRSARRVRRRLGAARGAISLEYLGVTLAAAAITLAIAAGTPQIRGAISNLMAEAVCALSGPDCVVDSGAEAEGPLTARVSADTDSDGLTDREERRLGLAWGDPDSDGDGLGDYLEVKGPVDSFTPSGTDTVISGRPDPKDPDSDDDGIPDGQEVRLNVDSEPGYVFDPLLADADRDGLSDPQELAVGTNPQDEETDQQDGGIEGLTDFEEVFTYGTDPNSVDTDGDGEWDDWEIRDGTDPLVDERSGLEKLLGTVEDIVLGDPLGTIAGGGAGAAAKLGGKGLKKFADEIAETGAKGADDVASRLDDAASRIDEALAATAITTSRGVARQSISAAALAARAKVEEGAVLWRVGTTGKSRARNAEFWTLEHPSTPGFASRYGIPPGNVRNADFIESAVVPPGGTFITREAPGVGPNLGGGIEVVVPRGGVELRSFSYIGR